MCPDHSWLEAATRGAAPGQADAPTQGPEALTSPAVGAGAMLARGPFSEVTSRPLGGFDPLLRKIRPRD
jgi:hypothetical protein